MSDYLPVENNPNLVRDKESRAILVTSQKEIDEYRKRKKEIQAKNERINSLERTVSELVKRVDAIERNMTGPK